MALTIVSRRLKDVVEQCYTKRVMGNPSPISVPAMDPEEAPRFSASGEPPVTVGLLLLPLKAAPTNPPLKNMARGRRGGQGETPPLANSLLPQGG